MVNPNVRYGVTRSAAPTILAVVALSLRRVGARKGGLMRLRFIGALLLATLPSVGLLPATAQVAGSAAIPRARDGKPNLSGIWQVMNAAAWDIQDHSAQKAIPAGQGVVEGNEIPYQPWALAKKKANGENRATLDPEGHCYLPGVPRATYMPFPFQIVQVPDMVTILYEYVNATRYNYTNGSRHRE